MQGAKGFQRLLGSGAARLCARCISDLYKAKLVSNMTARDRAEARLLARSQAAPPSMESLEGSIVWMPGELRGLDMDLAVGRRSWTFTQHMHEASIFVLPDPSSRSLAGGWIFDERLAMTTVGFCLKCLEPPGSTREILLTRPFRTENPACEQAFLRFEGPKLRVLDSMEVCADRKQKAINRRASAGSITNISIVHMPNVEPSAVVCFTPLFRFKLYPYRLQPQSKRVPPVVRSEWGVE